MKVLITGGTGLVGKHLASLLAERGHEVAILSRTQHTNIKTFIWDIPTQTIDKEALKWADAIVHLAGAGVAEKTWTSARKKEILESRVHSSRLLATSIRELSPSERPKIFVGASAIGYYGLDTGTQIIQEEASAGKEFLADVTLKWEQENETIHTLGLRLSLWRIGVVMAEEGGALPTMAKPVRWGVGAALGTGKQYISWIHIKDLVRMLIWALEKDEIQGTYNAVAPNPVTNLELTQQIAQVLGKPLILPAVPAMALRLMLGEMADMVLGGNRVSCEKIQKTGFSFEFLDINTALRNIWSK